MALPGISLPKGDVASSRTLSLTNSGTMMLSLTTPTLTGEGYTITSPTSWPQEIGSAFKTGDSLQVVVNFDTALLSNPSSAGVHEGSLTLKSNSDGSPATEILLSVEVFATLREAAIREETWILY
jgi:hypothetical protein